jgi:ribose transport system substrate-binding protein
MLSIKKISLMFLIIMLFSLLGACQSTPTVDVPAVEEPVVQEPEPETLRIGVSAQLVAHDWSDRAWQGIQDKASELGVEVFLLSAGQDPDKQLADIESMIEQGVDGIIILLAEEGVLDVGLQKTSEAGIPAVLVDGGVTNPGLVQSVSSDNCSFGEEAAEYIVQQKGEDARIVLQTYPVVEATNRRTECAKAYWEANYPNITILEEQPILGPEWTADAQTHAEQMITKYGGDIDAFGVCSDLFAIGSHAAVDAAGLSDQIIVLGVDGLDQIIEKIADPNSSMAVTFLQDSHLLGSRGLESLVSFINSDCSVPMSSACRSQFEEQAVYPGIMITKDNASQFVD